MITVIEAHSIARHRALLNSMFELRHSVFIDRLGWKLDSQDGREIDQFDLPETVYLVVSNPAGQAVASCRLLPTTKPNLLRDVFPFLASDGRPPCHPLIWEASRLSIDHRKDRLEGCENVCGVLLCGIMEYALGLGLTHLVSVSDMRVERLLTASGWNLSRLGEVHRINGMRIAGEMVAVSADVLDRIRAHWGISKSVLAVEDDHWGASRGTGRRRSPTPAMIRAGRSAPGLRYTRQHPHDYRTLEKCHSRDAFEAVDSRITSSPLRDRRLAAIVE